MRKGFLSLVMSTGLVWAASPGIRPRADAGSYAVHRDQPDFAIGAVVIPPQQVKKMFKADLNHAGYVVVEIGIFPAPGKDVDLYPSDFMLYAGEKPIGARPVSGDVIAEAVAGKPSTARVSSPHDIYTSTGVTVGHASYPDPTTGRRTGGTVIETGAGVGVGAPPPGGCRGYDCEPTAPIPPGPQTSPTQTANEVSQELWEKSLPDGKTARAVAGYLYFPKPSKKAKDGDWELRYENAEGKTRMTLPR